MNSYLLCSIAATYCGAALVRGFLPGSAGWLESLIAFHLAAGLALRFLTNAKWFAACIAMLAAAIEATLFRSLQNASLAIAASTVVELIPALYFARRFFFTMGD